MRPFLEVMQLFVNGKVEDTTLPSEHHVGANLVLCYSGSMFGYNGSPVYWIKNGEHFSDSIHFSSVHEFCDGYLSDVQSNSGMIDGSGGRIRSFVNLYRSDPCLLYNDRFTAILFIQSLEMNDNGAYDFHLENQNGFTLSDGVSVLDDIGQSC